MKLPWRLVVHCWILWEHITTLHFSHNRTSNTWTTWSSNMLRMTCFEIWNNLMVHWYYLIMSIGICCNTCCQCITIMCIILMYLILDDIYGFLYIRWEFHWILVIYRLYGNHSNVKGYVPSGHLYFKLYN